MLSAKVEAVYAYTYLDLNYSGYHKKPNVMIIFMHCFEETNDKDTIARNTV